MLVDVIFSGESLFQGQRSPWELTLTEPVPDIFEFVPLIDQKIVLKAKIKYLQLKLRVFLAADIVAMVTCYITRVTAICLPLI